MQTQTLNYKTITATYCISDSIIIRSEQDALDLMGETSTDAIILHDYNFDKDFFDLSTRKLGDVLQKFTNYRVNLAIIGDFRKYPSNSLPDFINETNRHRKYIFVSSLEEVGTFWN